MDERIGYLRELVVYDLELVEILDREHRGRDDLQPFAEPELGKFLSLLVRMKSMQRVLELGTGIGYSALWVAGALRETGGNITTIDNHHRTNQEARKFFAMSGLGEIIHPIEASIEQLLPVMAQDSPGTYDMIFQDGGKYLYPLVYESVYTLLSPGGILVTDDVLFPVEGAVRKGLKAPVARYNEQLMHDSRYCSSMLPVGHGITVSLKIGDMKL